MGKCVANNSLAIKLWSHGRAQRHLKQCQKSHCSKCWWASKGRKWKIFFPWLRFGERLEHRPGHGFGCSVCARFQHLKRTGFVLPAAQGRPIATPCRAVQEAQFDTSKTDFDNFTVEIKLKAFHLKRHQASQKHRQAVAFLEGFISEEDLSLAPSVDECRATLEAMRKGHSSRNGGSCSDRVNFLRWCLSESLLGLWRRELAASRTLCLMRDERKGKLLLRFRGCSGQLALCTGTFGCVRMTGGSAEDIVTATAKAMRVFCTPCFRPPRLGKALAGQGGFDKQLFAHLRKITQILTTDSHPAELLASNIMKGNRKSADDTHNRTPFLPNVVLVGRDAAHASTRLVKRPWACIPAIQDRTWTKTILASSSLSYMFDTPVDCKYHHNFINVF